MKISLENVNVKIEGGKAVLDLTEAQLAELTGQRQKPLADFSPGDTIIIADYDFIVLEHDEKGTLIILKDLLPARQFDPESNNWKSSSLRDWLYDSHLYRRVKAAVGETNIRGMDRNLISLDGLDDYGFCPDAISLLTFDEYRQYHTILGLKSSYSNQWWLLTPASTPSNGYSRGVGCVNGDGIPDWDYCNYAFGVRPVLKLNSSILVKPAK